LVFCGSQTKELAVMAKFAVNKTHSATKVSPFIANYGRKLRMDVDIRKKKESRESNGVCRKNEEGTRGSGNSIKKSIIVDETTSN